MARSMTATRVSEGVVPCCRRGAIERLPAAGQQANGQAGARVTSLPGRLGAGVAGPSAGRRLARGARGARGSWTRRDDTGAGRAGRGHAARDPAQPREWRLFAAVRGRWLRGPRRFAKPAGPAVRPAARPRPGLARGCGAPAPFAPRHRGTRPPGPGPALGGLTSLQEPSKATDATGRSRTGDDPSRTGHGAGHEQVTHRSRIGHG